MRALKKKEGAIWYFPFALVVLHFNKIIQGESMVKYFLKYLSLRQSKNGPTFEPSRRK